MGNLVKLETNSNKATPKPICHPADYSLALAAVELTTQWGKAGAINRMIEMVEWLKAGKHPFNFNDGKQRVDPSHD